MSDVTQLPVGVNPETGDLVFQDVSEYEMLPYPWGSFDSRDAQSLSARGRELLESANSHDPEGWHSMLDAWHTDIFKAVKDYLLSYTETCALAEIACMIELCEPERWYA